MNKSGGRTFMMLQAAALIVAAGLFVRSSAAEPRQNGADDPAQPEQAQPEAAPPAAPPAPRHLPKVIQDSEAQLAGLAAAARRESGPARLILEAEHEYLLLATQWLKPAMKDPEAGALQAHYGRKLLDHRKAFEEYLRIAALRMRSAPDQAGGESDSASVIGNSLQAFINRGKARGPAGDGEALMDQQLQAMFTDLSPGLAAVESHKPRSTWLMAVSRRAVALEESGFDAAQVDQLITQIHSARLSTEVRAELLALAQEARDAAGRPDGQGRASAGVYALRRAVEIAERLSEAEFSKPLDRLYRSHLRIAAQLVPDPRTRGAGLDRMDLMERGLSIHTLIVSLSRGAPRGTEKTGASLMTLLESAMSATISGVDTASGAAGLAALAEMANSMRASRDLLALKPPFDLEDVWRTLMADYLKQETLAAELASTLARDLKASSGEAARQTLDELAQAGDRLSRIRRVPDWIAALDRLQARPTGGAARELKALARAMARKSSKSVQAEADLARFQRQFDAVMSLPGEEKLGYKDGPEPAFGPLILQQIGRLRLQWAGAWASGGFDKAEEPARRLQQASELLAARRLVMEPGQLDQACARLNRWAAWHVSREDMRILLDEWNESVRSSMRLLSIGHSAGLDRVSAQIHERADLPLLIDYLNRLLADAWAPSEKFGAMADQFIPPAAEAFALSHRRTLARLGLHVSEAAQAMKKGQELVLADHRAEVNKHAAALVKAFSAP